MATEALAVAPEHKQTTLEIVDSIVRLMEMSEYAERPEDRAAWDEHIERLISVDLARQIDGCAWFEKRAKAEIAALEAMRDEVDVAIQRIKGRIDRIRRILRLAMDKLGLRSVKGQMHTCSLSAGRESLHITDEAAIPAEFKLVTLTVPAASWPHVQNLLAAEGVSVGGINAVLDKKAVRTALDDCIDVPGAEVRVGEPVLTIR